MYIIFSQNKNIGHHHDDDNDSDNNNNNHLHLNATHFLSPWLVGLCKYKSDKKNQEKNLKI